MIDKSLRKGEKIGWAAGWIGGYIWVGILSIIFIYQGKSLFGILGLVQLLCWIGLVIYFAPWRHPDKTYLVLMIPLYALFFITIIWFVWAFGGMSSFNELNWISFLWIIPTLIPLPMLYKKKWNDSKEKTEN